MIRGVLSSAPASSLLLPGICLLTQRDPCWGVWNRGLAEGAAAPHHPGTLAARRAGRGRVRSAGEGRGPYLILGAAQRVPLPSGPVAQQKGHRVQKEPKASLGRVFPVFSIVLLGAQPPGLISPAAPRGPQGHPGAGLSPAVTCANCREGFGESCLVPLAGIVSHHAAGTGEGSAQPWEEG